MRGGAVVAVDGLASAAGVELLRRGGSAVDAVVGANAVLAVTSPHMCGPGGDVWALVADSSEVVALDASGFAGSGADPEELRAAGHTEMPMKNHVASVTVPGAVDGWLALHERFGRLELAEVLAEAIRLAEEGFPASPLLAERASEVGDIAGNTDILRDLVEGQLLTRPGTARTLRAIAESGRDGFYGGEFGEALLELGAGEYTSSDLERPIARWVEPIQVDAYGHTIWTVPPSSQGYITLASAWIADGLEMPDEPNDVWVHLLVESATQAAHDRMDVLHEGADGQALLSPERLKPRRDAIDPSRASDVSTPAGAGDTTYMCAVDSDGMGVSLINSNASGFGANLIAGDTGIFLHDRGIGFNLEPGHPAEYGPRRRPPHTLSPALVTNTDGSLRMVLGTMGGDAQPQILLQLLDRILRLEQDSTCAVNAPRWVISSTDDDTGFGTWKHSTARQVVIEDASTGWADGLVGRGHQVVVVNDSPSSFGHAHVIKITDDGQLEAAVDPRCLIGTVESL